VTRIFIYLACFSGLFLMLALGLGLSLGDLGFDTPPEILRRATVHRLTGVAAGLFIVLVDSICVTYFVGTSRWIKEVVETYRLGGSFILRSAQLKRRTFPVAVCSMLLAVALVASGGAADPGNTLGKVSAFTWPQFHLVTVMAGGILVLGMFVYQWIQIDANNRVINDVMDEVRRVRLERGLDVEEPTPAGQA
jgi:hypothetical protein